MFPVVAIVVGLDLHGGELVADGPVEVEVEVGLAVAAASVDLAEAVVAAAVPVVVGKVIKCYPDFIKWQFKFTSVA